jgi:hypothetical protein
METELEKDQTLVIFLTYPVWIQSSKQQSHQVSLKIKEK